MIIDQDGHPERQLYYLGARTLEVMDNQEGPFDFFEVYKQLKEKEDISIKLFIYTVDWLYLLGIVVAEKGMIKRCI